MIGQKLGPYEITEEIGKGGMATVYRADHNNMDRFVAIKIIRKSILNEKTVRARFQREAKLIAREGSAFVAEFGIARAENIPGEHLTETGAAIGTPAYQAMHGWINLRP